jgi:hypothetical protein
MSQFRLKCGNEPVCDVVVPIINLVEEDNINLVPNDRLTYYRLGPITKVTFTVTVDSSKSKVGDQMIWLFNTNQHTLEKPTIELGPNIYYTACGRRSFNIVMNSSATGQNPNPNQLYQRLALTLTFDGDYWVYSGDNC